jgi:hypothetical protein
MKLLRVSNNEIINLDACPSISIVDKHTNVNNESGWKMIAQYAGIGENARPTTKVIGEYPDEASAKAAFKNLMTTIAYWFGQSAADKLIDYAELSEKPVTTDYIQERQANTDHITSVEFVDDDIIITLDCKVEELNTTDGGGAWGEHKWLGIGIGVTGVSSITDLYYNGQLLSQEDVAEAELVGVTSGFVRWVAADLVLAGDNTKASKSYFTLYNQKFVERTYNLKIVEG